MTELLEYLQKRHYSERGGRQHQHIHDYSQRKAQYITCPHRPGKLMCRVKQLRTAHKLIGNLIVCQQRLTCVFIISLKLLILAH